MNVVGLGVVPQLPKVKACLRVVVAPYETMVVDDKGGGSGGGGVGFGT